MEGQGHFEGKKMQLGLHKFESRYPAKYKIRWTDKKDLLRLQYKKNILKFNESMVIKFRNSLKDQRRAFSVFLVAKRAFNDKRE